MNEEGAHQRLERARSALGFTREQFAAAIKYPSIGAYWDLEAYPDDLFMCISLAWLQVLGGALDLDPLVLLCGSGATRSPGPISFAEISRALNDRREKDGVTADELSEEIGWEIGEVLVDPDALWNFNVDGLRDTCAALGIDWRRAVPAQASAS